VDTHNAESLYAEAIHATWRLFQSVVRMDMYLRNETARKPPRSNAIATTPTI